MGCGRSTRVKRARVHGQGHRPILITCGKCFAAAEDLERGPFGIDPEHTDRAAVHHLGRFGGAWCMVWPHRGP